MLRNIANNRIMTTVIILSIAAFSVFSMACEAETIVKAVSYTHLTLPTKA